jgi:hypothetical protein
MRQVLAHTAVIILEGVAAQFFVAGGAIEE